jgi:S-formylglutathione hydrolase FrmB
MALIDCHFHSDVLGRASSMLVLLPQRARTQIGLECAGAGAGSGRRLYPVLYLLHGLSDDHTIWTRRTSIERYVAGLELIVVMPNGDRGFYTDHEAGPRYWTMLSEELPALVTDMFPASTRREDTFAAGLSMGGYGALKLALRCPDRYAAAVGLSSVADIRQWLDMQPQDPERKRIFGGADRLAERGNDLFALAESAVRSATPPRLLQVCGTEDGLYQGNVRFREHLRSLSYPGYEYREGPGTHNWAFWDTWIQAGLQFLCGGSQKQG